MNSTDEVTLTHNTSLLDIFCNGSFMKKLLIIFTLLFSVMFSSTSFSEWKEVAENEDGQVFYVDFESINKKDGYIYYWLLIDFSKPDKDGDLSVNNYRQTDCKLIKHKDLTFYGYKEPMGIGKPIKYGVFGKITKENLYEARYTYSKQSNKKYF